MTNERKIKISDLTPLDYNPREISPAALDGLMASIREFSANVEGWDAANGLRMVGTITVNVNGNRIIGGHQRVKALLELGQDWIHADDITWVNIEPDSVKEKGLCVTLNNHEIAGDFSADLDALLLEIELAVPELSQALLLSELLGVMPSGDPPEIDESVADAVEMVVCPFCQKEFPK
ncbi:ParB N-terminal domain-containing protein [Candidatus Sumerlaeota bacterium]|nr:ParB N-terminal domain-containing protein [Candidatus Sumerlaeota bacterium]